MGNRIVVQRKEAETTKGGILLPESAQKKPREGIVIAVGQGQVNDKGQVQKMDVKVNDRVLFSSYGGTDYKIDGQEYLVLSEEDVLAVYN
jgi:chaperonin GroES